MFGWRSKPGTEEERQAPDLDEIKSQDLAVLFKHSPTCGVRWAAESQVKKFIAGNPDIPVYTISVRQDRELSRRIAEETRIRHELSLVFVFLWGVSVVFVSFLVVSLVFLSRAVEQ